MPASETIETFMDNIKTTLRDDSTFGPNVKKFEYIQDGNIPYIQKTQVPYVGIAAVSWPEEWISTGKRQVVFTVRVFIVNHFMQRETPIVGSGASIRGMTDYVMQAMDALRNQTFSNYLSRPIELSPSASETLEYEDSAFQMVATITAVGNRIFVP